MPPPSPCTNGTSHHIQHSPRHTNDWAPRTRKRHQREHRPQRPTERSDPTQHAKGRTGDCPGPRKETTTRRNVTQGGTPPPLPMHPWCRPLHSPTAMGKVGPGSRVQRPPPPPLRPLQRLHKDVKRPGTPHLRHGNSGAPECVAPRPWVAIGRGGSPPPPPSGTPPE